MGTINQRIAACVEASGLTKTAFAKQINLSQPHISKMALGESVPSDRTISDICREFNVNETWLRTGNGDMFIQITRDEEIASFMGSVLAGENDNFKRKFISVLSRLNESQWELLEVMAIKLADEYKKD